MARPAPKKRGATAASRRRSSASRRWGPPGWLWGLVGLVAGFLLAQHQHGTAPWQTGEDSPLANLLPRPAATEESTPPSQPAPAEDEPQMPTFEFYTLLPETEVIAPRSEMPASTARPPAPSSETDDEAEAPAVDDPIARVIAANLKSTEPSEPSDAAESSPPASGDNRYMLQAASFREQGDAQQLSERLRNLSLVAQVSRVQTSGGDTWHRVQVGPYQDTRELNRAQDLMITQGIEPLLIRLQN